MPKQPQWSTLPFPEFDYVRLTDLLKDHSQPRRVINYLLKTEHIERVKKGIYVLGKNNPYYAPPSQFRLANIIYGPSYLSLQSALSFYGLIPEAVHEVTSVTPKRKKYFDTSRGAFSYWYIHHQYYAKGITLIPASQGGPFLIATPEKALVDILQQNKTHLRLNKIEEFLLDDLRIDEAELCSFDKESFLTLVALSPFSKSIKKEIENFSKRYIV
jgi:predicted transcriptional regulator of viral defense system